MRTLLLIPALAGSLALSAQNFPFPSSDATWVQYFEMMITPPPVPVFAWMSSANFCMDGSDTLIGGTSYTQLRYCNAGYMGGIREIAGEVYFHPADSTQEYLLYDFGAAVGDTLHDIYVNEPLATGGSSGWVGTRLLDVVVTSTGPDPNYGGRVHVQVLAADPLIGMDSQWIEGMGCVHGLFTFNPLNVSEYWFGLDCFSHQDTTYWNGSYTQAAGVCAPQYVGVDELRAPVARAYPNPTSGAVRVEGMGSDVTVRDAIGRPVQVPVSRVSNAVIDLDLRALPTGLYTAQDGLGRTVRLCRE
ncbi:MAG: T9SS type A sorting domain-containing protein [Flavobacteriales bacterium]|nr:T9SS type A sorting domain-containing protein [Flavobacteriales bacterium]